MNRDALGKSCVASASYQPVLATRSASRAILGPFSGCHSLFAERYMHAEHLSKFHQDPFHRTELPPLL